MIPKEKRDLDEKGRTKDESVQDFLNSLLRHHYAVEIF